ncbi:MAG: sensor histidine kinase [Flavobacteriales bacterium]|nr:sensor histidine kinase [Flavobacteriales bacterium]
MSRSRELQSRIAHEVRLLDELTELNDGIHQLALVHRVDVDSRQYNWSNELRSLNDEIVLTQKLYSDAPGMDRLSSSLIPVLMLADSLHRDAMQPGTNESQARATEAVFQIMVQRAQKVVDRTARSVHEQGISRHTGTLSARWNEAQFLLITACLFAVVFAWLVGISNRLLIEARSRSEQLATAKQNLESTNKELRETMLSKEEKEVMIKEIHHRVKNNLQIVKSLIRFQMDQVDDERTNEMFNECVNRVSAMALVHEQTYLSKDLANIDVSSYLDHLIRDLCAAYTIDMKLDLDIKIEVPTLSVDTLIPLGLIINEIISNSLKYAFKDRKEGVIMVHIYGDQLAGISLRIGDNGIGLPDRSRWSRPETLGMELIHTLAEQLDATVELANGPGTVYEIVSTPIVKLKRA